LQSESQLWYTEDLDKVDPLLFLDFSPLYGVEAKTNDKSNKAKSAIGDGSSSSDKMPK
jgi:hypothetical protein